MAWLGCKYTLIRRYVRAEFNRRKTGMKQTIKLIRKPMYLTICLALSLAMGCASANTQRTGQVVKKEIPGAATCDAGL